ncbi:hypothetical protein Hypma_008824 [Hypsizygus marmoreus]|uniref:Uncharacterized protein n=1 Tax=Hypsizygus marmoreus TaxID=39966 RepID=A0A369JUW3_HYPMA|nr:hypothetical protein Hypma_008824 [Hypsizygus marmoreus]
MLRLGNYRRMILDTAEMGFDDAQWHNMIRTVFNGGKGRDELVSVLADIYESLFDLAVGLSPASLKSCIDLDREFESLWNSTISTLLQGSDHGPILVTIAKVTPIPETSSPLNLYLVAQIFSTTAKTTSTMKLLSGGHRSDKKCPFKNLSPDPCPCWSESANPRSTTCFLHRRNK